MLRVVEPEKFVNRMYRARRVTSTIFQYLL